MVTREHIAKRLRDWRKDNLLRMKNLAEGMGSYGSDEDLVREYKWLAQDCVRLKDLIKKFK